MSHENRAINMNGVENMHDVSAECWDRVPVRRSIGGPVPPARHSDDVPTVEKCRRELIKDMCGVAKTRENEDRWSGPAPVDELETDAVTNTDFSDLVTCWITPGTCAVVCRRCACTSREETCNDSYSANHWGATPMERRISHHFKLSSCPLNGYVVTIVHGGDVSHLRVSRGSRSMWRPTVPPIPR